MGRSQSENTAKLANINPAMTEVVMMRYNGDTVKVFKNEAINLVVDADDTTILYKLANDGSIKRQLKDYACLDVIVANQKAKVSRNRLIPMIIGDKSSYTPQATKPSITKESNPKDDVIWEDFNPNLTKIITKNNIEFIFNDGINLMFNMYTGEAYNVKSGKKMNGNTSYVKFFKDGKLQTATMVNSRTIAMMWGFDVPHRNVVKLKDEKRGYLKANIVLVSLSEHMSNMYPKGASFGSQSANKLKEHVSTHNVVKTYVSEDNMKFNDGDEALNHQIKLDAAKEVAQLLIDSKCGYELAEKVFLKTLGIERKDVKYKNFVDLMNNNDGVKIINKERIEVGLQLDSILVDFDHTTQANTLICEIKALISKLTEL